MSYNKGESIQPCPGFLRCSLDKMKVDESPDQTRITLIDYHHLGSKKSESYYQLSRKIWWERMRVYESRWEGMRVSCQPSARVWTLVTSHPHLIGLHYKNRSLASSRLFTASLFSQIVVAVSKLELSVKRDRGGMGRGRSARFRSLSRFVLAVFIALGK